MRKAKLDGGHWETIIMSMNSNTAPLVSILISTYNDERYIVESINSILNQTYSNIEVLVVNDASTDHTGQLLQQIQDRRVSIIENETNCKLAANLNKMIRIAKGKYLARMDADDISLPERIAHQVRYMEEHPDVDVLGTWTELIGNSTGIVTCPCDHDQICTALLFQNIIAHPTVIFRASTCDYQYDENLPAGQDYELWSRIIWNKRFAILPEVLLQYRIHPNQTKFRHGARQKAGAKAARERMYQHLMEIPVSEAFNMLFDYATPKTVEEISDIEHELRKLLETNRQRAIYQDLTMPAWEQFYRVWYYSVGLNGVTVRQIRYGLFAEQYRAMPLVQRAKCYAQILRNRMMRIAQG